MHKFHRSSAGFIAVALLVSLCSSGYCAEYYKWTDEDGNLHFSDSLSNVPEKYRKQIESKRFEDDKPSSPEPRDRARPAKQPSADKEKGGIQPKRYEVVYTPYGGSAKRVIISVTFNGSVTAPIAIDTGAPGTMISVALAKRLGLFDEDQGRLIISAGGIGGTAPAIRSIVDTIQVGGAKINFIPTTIITSISDSFEGLLGLDFVSNYSVTIDSRRKLVVFEELPADPNMPGGHDQEWWSAHFREFGSLRAKWMAYSEALDKEIRDSLISTGNKAKAKKAFADSQYREAEKLFDKLNRYATENAVPLDWRQY
jgi:hypothetical protein